MKKLRLGRVETPKQASVRYDAVQKKLKDEFQNRVRAGRTPFPPDAVYAIELKV